MNYNDDDRLLENMVNKHSNDMKFRREYEMYNSAEQVVASQRMENRRIQRRKRELRKKQLLKRVVAAGGAAVVITAGSFLFKLNTLVDYGKSILNQADCYVTVDKDDGERMVSFQTGELYGQIDRDWRRVQYNEENRNEAANGMYDILDKAGLTDAEAVVIIDCLCAIDSDKCIFEEGKEPTLEEKIEAINNVNSRLEVLSDSGRSR